MTSIIDRAIKLGERVPVFPCREDKKPACKNGFKDAVSSATEIVDLWTKYPGPLIGVPMGKASGFDALDIDPRHEGDKWLDEFCDALPVTRTHITRSGGKHLLFRSHPDVRNSQSKIAPGVDTRGAGGYIVWWAAHQCAVENRAIVETWPTWIIKILRPAAPLPPPPIPTTKHEADTRAALMIERAFMRVRSAAPGERHHTLRAAARTLGGLTRFLHQSDSELARYLTDLIMSTGAIDRLNAEKTAAWAIDRGRQAPLLQGR
jgi:hypothetical protein